jgi:hypothetical protein
MRKVPEEEPMLVSEAMVKVSTPPEIDPIPRLPERKVRVSKEAELAYSIKVPVDASDVPTVSVLPDEAESVAV